MAAIRTHCTRLSITSLQTISKPLEKVAVEAFKLGYEVTEPEELEVEEGDMVICCDILSECALNADLIDARGGTADDAGRKI